jgi:hypothetical protein
LDLLSFLLPRPAFDKTPEMLAAFEQVFLSTPAGGFVDYTLPYPKWQYLTYLCEAKELVLHGSQNLDIDEVEPRQAVDVKAFSNQQAIYATTDGIFVIYFAIIDRKQFPLSLFNSCFQVRMSPDQLSDPFYFFSISHPALLQKPWCPGAIYILPRQDFEQEPAQMVGGAEILLPHWVSARPACPVAKLLVLPQDFPFLAQVHGHNDARLVELTAADPGGFPWPEALES